MVCQNQSIDDSEAPLAHDLRVLVRERLEAGDSDRQVLDFLVARYGEFVLLKPPFELAHAAAVGRCRRWCCSAARSRCFVLARRRATVGWRDRGAERRSEQRKLATLVEMPAPD